MLPPQWVGLKFFNVFGPTNTHKGEMMSLAAKRFDDAKAGRPVVLFKSHRADIADGDQRRDFVYVDDAVAVTPGCSGIPTFPVFSTWGPGAPVASVTSLLPCSKRSRGRRTFSASICPCQSEVIINISPKPQSKGYGTPGIT